MRKYGGLIADDAMLLVRGKYERDEETSRLVVAEMTPLDVVRDRAVREVEIRLSAAMASASEAMRALVGVSIATRAIVASRSSSS